MARPASDVNAPFQQNSDPVIWHYIRTIEDGTDKQGGSGPYFPVQVVNEELNRLYERGYRIFMTLPGKHMPGGTTVVHILVKPEFLAHNAPLLEGKPPMEVSLNVESPPKT